MDLPRGHNEYYPLEDSFSDLIGSGRDVFAGDAFPPFPETQTDAGGYPLSGIHYPGPNDVMFGRYVVFLSVEKKLYKSAIYIPCLFYILKPSRDQSLIIILYF